MTQFSCSIDFLGNIFVAGGSVIDLKTSTTSFQLIGGNPTEVPFDANNNRKACSPNAIFVGGGGGNMITSGTVSGTFAPIGYFSRTGLQTWQDQFGNTITADDTANTAEITDSVDVIATLSSSFTTAPYGTFTATTYGEDTYNGGSAFTLTSEYEGSQQATAAVVYATSGVEVPSGNYSQLAYREWTSDDEPLWIITSADDGSAELTDSTSAVATRATGLADSPAGTYTGTAYGKVAYGFDRDFTIRVDLVPAKTRQGYVYVSIEKSGASFVAATGPFFASSLPTNTSSLEIVPIAYSDGNGRVQQIHEGPILWR